MQTQSSSQQQAVSKAEAHRSARESVSSQIRSRAADDQQRFSEGFIAGWYSLMGHRVVPTIIPDCEIPVGKSPFEYGYDRARSFINGVEERGGVQTGAKSAMLSDKWAGPPPSA
jgi:hypothetical protein